MRNKIGTICMILGVALVLAALSLFVWNQRENQQAGAAVDEVLPKLREQIEQTARDKKDGLQDSGASGTDMNDTASNVSNSGNSDTDGENGGSSQISGSVRSRGSIQASDLGENGISTQASGSEENRAFSQVSGVGANGNQDDFYIPSVPERNIDGNTYIGYLTIPALNLELPVMSKWNYKRLRIAPCRYTGSVQTDDLVIAAHNYARHFGSLSKLSEGDEVYFTDADGVLSIYEVVLVETLGPTDVIDMIDGEYDLTLFTCTYGGKSRVTVRCERT